MYINVHHWLESYGENRVFKAITHTLFMEALLQKIYKNKKGNIIIIADVITEGNDTNTRAEYHKNRMFVIKPNGDTLYIGKKNTGAMIFDDKEGSSAMHIVRLFESVDAAQNTLKGLNSEN